MADPWKRKEVIGECTLYLGSSPEIVGGVSYSSIVSDPPFGMSFRSNYRIERHKEIAADDTAELLVWVTNLPASHSKYIFCRWDNLADVPKPKSCVTWVKNNWSMGDLEHEHGRQTEVCVFYPGPEHYFPAGRPSDVINWPRTGNVFHPTEKPLGLMRIITGWTSGAVLDPFMGSGTTLVACAKLGRSGIGIEIDPDYFEIACRRVEEAYRQPDLLIHYAPPAKPTQEVLL